MDYVKTAAAFKEVAAAIQNAIDASSVQEKTASSPTSATGNSETASGGMMKFASLDEEVYYKNRKAMYTNILMNKQG